jgi:KaiC/GvpD/RAD55 family RecA-like ATPase
MAFTKATKSQARLRLALVGPSGSGKTFSALAIASHLVAGREPRIAVIDTEHGSASKYAHVFAFDSEQLGSFDPRNYIAAIQEAEAARYDVLVIDSLSHAWTGKGGMLDIVDAATRRSRSKNAFTEGWREASPLHNELIEAIVGCSCHVIATMRTKTDYAMNADPNTGKLAPEKIGLAPVQRDGMDYEFDVVADLRINHDLIVTKTRCETIDGLVVNKPGKRFAEQLRDWLTDGKAIPPSAVAVRESAASQAASQVATPAGGREAASGKPERIGVDPIAVRRLLALAEEAKLSPAEWESSLAKRGVSRVEDLTPEAAQNLYGSISAYLEKSRANNVHAEPETRTEPEASSTPTFTVPSVEIPTPVIEPATSADLPEALRPEVWGQQLVEMIVEQSKPTGDPDPFGQVCKPEEDFEVAGGKRWESLHETAIRLIGELEYTPKHLSRHLAGFGVQSTKELDVEGLWYFISHLEESKSQGSKFNDDSVLNEDGSIAQVVRPVRTGRKKKDAKGSEQTTGESSKQTAEASATAQ